MDVNKGYITDTTNTATPIPIMVSKIGSNNRSKRAIYFHSSSHSGLTFLLIHHSLLQWTPFAI